MRSISFAIRFFAFVGLVLLLVLAAVIGFVAIGVLGLFLTGPSLVVGITLLLAAIVAVPLLLWSQFQGPQNGYFAQAIGLLVLMAIVIALYGAGAVPLGVALIAFGFLGLLGLLGFVIWFVFGVHRMPLHLVGVGDLEHLPGVPFRLSDLFKTVVGLLGKAQQLKAAQDALTSEFTFGGKTATGKTFVYGAGESRSLEDPAQFAIGWSTIDDMASRAAPLAPHWSAALTDADAATELFWPMLAQFSVPFNILPLTRVDAAAASRYQIDQFASQWSSTLDGILNANRLYAIDLTSFEKLEPPSAAYPRFTPATLTLLERRADRSFVPLLVWVSNGETRRVYDPSMPQTWMYALQASRCSVTVWGIWVGHVHHFHTMTTVLQMAMYQVLPRAHPVRQVLEYQSGYMIGFDEVLMLDWGIGPPTSVDTTEKYLRLADRVCDGRNFHDDDPIVALAAQGLEAVDFTSPGSPEDWDLYPVARYLRRLWDATGRYVTSCVDAIYPNDAAVAADVPLRAWVAAARAPSLGNVRGLPVMDGKAKLVSLLTSLLFRITQHGMHRLSQTANPALSFVANYPPCLEDSRIPEPGQPLSLHELLAFQPETRTIGAMLTFLYVFAYADPYESLIPAEGIDARLPFRGPAGPGCNAALSGFRAEILEFIRFFAGEANRLLPQADMRFQATPAQIRQWELSIEQ